MTTTQAEVKTPWPWSAVGRTVWVDHTPMTGRVEGVQVSKSGRPTAFLIRMKGHWPGVIRRQERDVSFRPNYDRTLYPGKWNTNPLIDYLKATIAANPMPRGEWPPYNVRYLEQNIRSVFRHESIKALTRGTYEFLIMHMGFIAHYNMQGFRDVYHNVRYFAWTLLTSEYSDDTNYNELEALRYRDDAGSIRNYGRKYCWSVAEGMESIVKLAREYLATHPLREGDGPYNYSTVPHLDFAGHPLHGMPPAPSPNPAPMRPEDYDALRKTIFGFLATNTSIDPERALRDSSSRWYIYRQAGPFPNKPEYWYLTQSMIDKALKGIIQEYMDTPQEEKEKHVYPLYAALKHNRLIFSEYRIVFQLTFHQPLQRYWNSIFGFDIVKFDDEIARSGENESVADAVRAKYGEDALRLVEKLL